MFEFTVRKPIVMTVVILIVCLFGLTSISRIPKQMIPDLDVRTVRVRTTWPGATPQDIEKEIIIEANWPFERAGVSGATDDRFPLPHRQPGRCPN